MKPINYSRLFNYVLNDNKLSANEKNAFVMRVYENGNTTFAMEHLEKHFDNVKANLDLERLLMEISRKCIRNSQFAQVKCIAKHR